MPQLFKISLAPAKVTLVTKPSMHKLLGAFTQTIATRGSLQRHPNQLLLSNTQPPSGTTVSMQLGQTSTGWGWGASNSGWPAWNCRFSPSLVHSLLHEPAKLSGACSSHGGDRGTSESTFMTSIPLWSRLVTWPSIEVKAKTI